MDFDKDYYAILGLENTASIDEIKKAYRVLAKKYHPDINKSSNAADIFNAVSDAYEVLSDPKARETYDAAKRPHHKDNFNERRAGEGRREEAAGKGPSQETTSAGGQKGLVFVASLIAPGLVQVDAGEKKLGGWLMGSYFIFWVLGIVYGLEIAILALLVWGYAVLDAYSILKKG